MPASPFLSHLRLPRFISANLPPLLWAGVIFWFSSQSTLPSLQLSLLDFVSRKLAHIGVYLVLFLLVYRSILLQNLAKPRSAKAFILVFTICLVYAISDELHQLNVPGRYGSLRDIGYDGLGLILAFLRRAGYI